MYSTLPSSLGLKVLLIGFGFVVYFGTWAVENFALPWSDLRLISLSAGVYLTLVAVLFGGSWYWSPWRLLWRVIPALNHWIYPDINGVWFGATRSNWSVIERVREAARVGKVLNLDELADVGLLPGNIAMEVKASLFKISVRSKTHSTLGDSKTLVAKAEKLPDTGDFRLVYIYQQDTPDPAASDEGSHIGAATLTINVGSRPKLDGDYWTRRKWREGMNTAGHITVDRVSRKHRSDGEELMSYAADLAEKAQNNKAPQLG